MLWSGTLQSKDQATSPRTLLEHIVNFFTFGGVRRALSAEYDELAKEITAALNLANPDYKIPGPLIVNHCGFTITCTPPGENNSPGPITITVSKNGETATAEIDPIMYHRVCLTLLIRHRCGLPFSATPLTDDKMMDLKGANLQNADLRGAVIHNADLQGANLSGCDLRSSALIICDLREANLQYANLQGVKMRRVNLERADLYQANLQHAETENVILENANLQRAG